MFVKNKEYVRKEIHYQWGGQQFGGISTPSRFPLIFIFTGESGEDYGYNDGWKENNIFFYTGEGQIGDMELTKGNKAIANHIKDGKDIFLFKYDKKGSGKVRFIDQMTCIGFHFGKGLDKENNERTTIIFELEPNEIINDPDTKQNNYIESDLKRLRELALKKGNDKITTTKQRSTEVRERSSAVRDYALLRANGICEACEQSAPFMNFNNSPFLEVHHLLRLSDGGPDLPENVAAICPNCHKRVHYGKDHVEYNHTLIRKIRKKELKLFGL